MSDVFTNANLPNQGVPITDSSGRATREFWMLLLAIFNRTGGAGSPIDTGSLQTEVEALQQVAYVLSAASTNLPNADVLDAGAGLTLDLGSGTITLSLTIPVTVANGGTGLQTLQKNAVVLGNGASAPNFAAPVTAGYVLTDNGSSAAPSFQALPATVNSILAGTGISVSSPTGNVTVSLQTPVAVTNGGTGANAAGGTALDNISGFSGTGLVQRTGAGAYSFVAISTFLQAANNLSDVANAGTARGNLGLGTMAVQAASAVAITGGSIAGTPISGSTGSFGSGTTGYDVTITNTAGGNGGQLHIIGNGSTTPSKTVRVNGGVLQILNDAYSASILSLGDTGNFAVAGTFGFNPATTTTSPSAGGAGALPATPTGYATVTIGGTARKIAYY